MLSNLSRWLTYTCALLYAILGALLFLFPAQLAPVFAWKVTAFMTITIGGWCLGNAWLAYINARRWEWKLVYISLMGEIIFLGAALPGALRMAGVALTIIGLAAYMRVQAQ